jgi:hypothetical protein
LDLARNLCHREQLGAEARRAATTLFDRSVSITRFIRYLEEQLYVTAPSALGMHAQNHSKPNL